MLLVSQMKCTGNVISCISWPGRGRKLGANGVSLHHWVPDTAVRTLILALFSSSGAELSKAEGIRLGTAVHSSVRLPEGRNSTGIPILGNVGFGET